MQPGEVTSSMSLLMSYLASCFFIKNPNHLIPSRSFTIKNVIYFLILGIIVEGLIADFADGTLEVSLRLIMATIAIASFLALSKRLADFANFYTAIFVCENFIFTLAAVVEAIYFYMIMAKFGQEQSEMVAFTLGGILLVWYLAIIAYVIRRFSYHSVLESVLLAISYFVLTYGIPMMFMDM